MDEVFSCRFGTFLANSALEIEELQLPQLTPSLWGNILSRKDLFRNRLYAPNNTTLSFSCSSRVIKFWDAFFLRWDCSAMCKEDSIVNEIIQKIKSSYLFDIEKHWDTSAGFGIIESNLWIIDELKNKGYDGIYLLDKAVGHDHTSIALFTENYSIEEVEYL